MRCFLETQLNIESKGRGGHPAYDYVYVQICIIQQYYGLSDDQAEFQINDRMSFMRFLDLTISDNVPDSKTIWNFSEKLKDLNLVNELFELFTKELNRLGLIGNKGKIIDSSFVETRRQRNNRDDNTHIKTNGTPTSWDDKPNKKRQKDVDARWIKKSFQNYYGYKNHVKIDSKSKLIDDYTVTDALVHDSQTVDELLNEKDKGQELYADSAYVRQEEILEKDQVVNKIHE